MDERIKELRMSVGLSQKEFGVRIGVSDTAVSKIDVEKGIQASKQYYRYVENLMSITLGLWKDLVKCFLIYLKHY